MAQPQIASLFLVNSDCFLFLWFLTKFCTRATAGGAAIFKINAAICLKQMWLTHTYSGMHAHTYTNHALYMAQFSLGGINAHSEL